MMTWGTGDDRRADYQAASPCEMCNAPQHVLEPILLDAARAFGADIRFNHEVVAVRQTPERARRAGAQPTGRRASSRSARATSSAATARARSSASRAGSSSKAGRSGQRDHRLDRSRSHALHQAPLRRALLRLQSRQRRRAQHLDLRRALDGMEHHLRALRTDAQRPLRGDGDARACARRSAIPSVDVRIKKISEWQFNHVVAADYRAGAAVPRRRCRPPPSARQRSGEQYLDSGQLQSGVEAGPGARRQGR